MLFGSWTHALVNGIQTFISRAVTFYVEQLSIDCLVCSDRKASVFFKPWGLMIACHNCAQIMKNCIQNVQCQRNENKESNQTDLQTIAKSGPVVAMSKSNMMSPNVNRASCNRNALLTMSLNLGDKIKNLQQQLKGIKEKKMNQAQQIQQTLQYIEGKMLCQVCFDRRKNMVFMCGHGTCRMCGARLKRCPFCRKPVEKRIFLFN